MHIIFKVNNNYSNNFFKAVNYISGLTWDSTVTLRWKAWNIGGKLRERERERERKHDSVYNFWSTIKREKDDYMLSDLII